MITLDTNLSTASSSSSSFPYLLAKLRKKYGYNNKNVQNTSSYSSSSATQSQNTNQTNSVDDQNQVATADSIDYEQLIEDLKLNVSDNRFALLLHMPRQELVALLHLLGKENLLNGLKFFSKSKLMGFLSGLSKQELLKMLFKMFTDSKQLIENLPTKELYNFLRSDKVEKGYLMKTFGLMPKNSLATIARYLTGKNCDNMNKAELLKAIEPFKKFHIVDGMKKLGERDFREIISTMVETNPKLYMEFSQAALLNVAGSFAKTDLIEGMSTIEPTKIIGMLSELPESLLALTVSQIDPEVFAAILINSYKDLLASMVLG